MKPSLLIQTEQFTTMMRERGWWEAVEKRRLAPPTKELAAAYETALRSLKGATRKRNRRERKKSSGAA